MENRIFIHFIAVESQRITKEQRVKLKKGLWCKNSPQYFNCTFNKVEENIVQGQIEWYAANVSFDANISISMDAKLVDTNVSMLMSKCAVQPLKWLIQNVSEYTTEKIIIVITSQSQNTAGTADL